ncbi:MAG: hypothetical protein JWM57_2182 [Phycisphaerales bacterium]|nr:hypothetical protein [Phycisphaerales bacterium]
MADEMEQIEARLAAYVDGTLPVEQRAEIEAYLKANPTHGTLIAELKSIKSAVMALPKEKAPAEILDTLQSHLERHTLLEGVEESVGSSRIRRWPQVGALAAVLLLTAGLGILVYQVLPQKKGPSPELALLPESTQQVTADDSPAAMQGLGGGVNLNDATNNTSNNMSNGATDARKADNESNGLPPTADAARRRDMAARQAPGQQMYQNQFGAVNEQQSNQSLAGAQAPMVGAAQSPEMRSLAAAYPAAKAKAASTEPAPLNGPVRVLTITTDDPVITQNLMASYFAQAQLPTERMEKGQLAALTEAEGPKDSTDTILLPTDALHDLQTSAFDRNAPMEASPPTGGLLLRNLSAEKLSEIETAVKAQRPTRQHAQLSKLGVTNAVVANGPAVAAAPTATPAAAPTTASASQPAPTTMPLLNLPPTAMAFKAEAAVPPTTHPLVEPTTMPDVVAGLISPGVAPASNLVILVVPAPASTQPTTLPATQPTTEPAMVP